MAAILLGRPHSSTKPLDSDWSKASPHVPGYVRRGPGDEGVERPLQRGEPQAVVDKLGPALLHLPLEPGQVQLDADALQLTVRGDQRDRRGRLVDLPALDADEPVLDHVD